MVKERIIDGRILRDLRKQTNVNQKVFSELTGEPLMNIKFYETNRRGLKLSKFREMKQSLGYVLENENCLRVMIDYLRITFKNVTDLDFFCRKFLYCPLSEFQSEETRLMNYTSLWRRGDIWIFDFADKSLTNNYQITVQMSGSGCRQFELIMEREKTEWITVLQKMYFERDDMKVTRIDVAMDEMWQGYENLDQHFLLSDMISRVYRKEVDFDRLKTWNHIGGGSIPKEIEDEEENLSENSQGISIYFGSRQSDLFFNFYEKRYEYAKKEGMTVWESLEVFGVWNRYEARFSQGKAHKLVEEFVSGVDLAELVVGIVNKEIQVYDGTNSYGAYLPDKKWQRLFGGVDPVKLTVKPEPYSIERTIRWLIHSVSDNLAMVVEADKKMATDYLRIIFESGEIDDKKQAVIDSLQPQDRELIDSYLKKGIRRKNVLFVR